MVKDGPSLGRAMLSLHRCFRDYFVVASLFPSEVGKSYRTLVEFLSPDQLSSDNHPFFIGILTAIDEHKGFI